MTMPMDFVFANVWTLECLLEAHCHLKASFQVASLVLEADCFFSLTLTEACRPSVVLDVVDDQVESSGLGRRRHRVVEVDRRPRR
jgi:hypothetical protein